MNISLIILLIIAFFMIVNFSNGATFEINNTANNSDIQNIINNAKSGDTIKFNGNTYNNISLSIDKKINIGSVNKTIINSNSGPAFYFKQGSSGSSISGFKIMTNGDYGIHLEKVSDFTISNNEISKSSNNNGGTDKALIFADSSNNLKITNNYLYDSPNYNSCAIYIKDSTSVNIGYNKISNLYQGIILKNTNKVNIHHNNITKLFANGIDLEGTTEKTTIEFNRISYCANGIYVNSKSKDDIVRSNIISNCELRYGIILNGEELDSFETGNSILFGVNYKALTVITVDYNIVNKVQNFGIKANPSVGYVTINGENHFEGFEDTRFFCPMMLARIFSGNLTLDQNGFLVKTSNNNQNNVPSTKPNSKNKNQGTGQGNGGNKGGSNNSNTNGSNNSKSDEKANATAFSVGEGSKSSPSTSSKAYELVQDPSNMNLNNNVSLLSIIGLIILLGSFGLSYFRKNRIR